MRTTARWAFWRRLWYGTGFTAVLCSLLLLVYFQYFYSPANCFDNFQNGAEQGVDCGGACTRICAFTIIPPAVKWAQSFKITDGQYNAVAYIENRNEVAATPEIPYTLSLFDSQGLIVERTGTTILPPDSVYPVFEGRIETGDREPTRTTLTLGEASVWLPAASGREQFTVVNRTLADADSRPRLDATIANNALTPAESVEVVATIFDARGNALTASRTFIDKLAPRTEAQAVFTWPQPIAKTVRSCEVPTDVVLAIDLSGSMNNDQANPPEPVTSVIAAADAFTQRLRDQDQGAVVTFATNAKVDLGLTGDLTRVSEIIRQLNIDPQEERGNTNTGAAFVQALAELTSDRHNASARKVMVILTDGLATAPEEEPEAYALDQAAKLKAAGVEVYAIGLGEQVNMEFVRALADEPGKAFQALTRSQVDAIYREITGAICEDGPAVIDIIPKSAASFDSLE